MTRNKTLALATALMIASPLAGAAQGSAPASQAAAIAQPVMLDAVIVTPTRQYSAAEWQARTAAAQPVLLAKVVVTPSRSYTAAEWNARTAERQYASTELRKARSWLRAVFRTLGLKSHPQEV